jgi:hypothetical protein
MPQLERATHKRDLTILCQFGPLIKITHTTSLITPEIPTVEVGIKMSNNFSQLKTHHATKL